MGTLSRRARILLVMICPLLASACAGGPIAYLGAAYSAADGVSYAATEKSIVDNAISNATGKDCRLLNPVVKGKDVCLPGERELLSKIEMMNRMLLDVDCDSWTFTELNEPKCINRIDREESRALP